MIQFVECKIHTVDGAKDVFAFFNSVTDKFIEIRGEHVFESVHDLREVAFYELDLPMPMERLELLIPSGPKWERREVIEVDEE